jgi:hypothetical protein
MKNKYQIVNAADGSPSLLVRVNGRELPIHSRISPRTEEERFASLFDPEHFDTIIVLGLGLGYHLAPLKNTIRMFKQIIIIDAIEGIDRELNQSGISPFLFEEENVCLLTGKDQNELNEVLDNLLDFSQIRGITVIEHAASIRAFAEYYIPLKRDIQKMIDAKAANAATIKAFAPLYARNSLIGLSLLKGARPVSALFKKFTGMPAVIAASAPSIEKNIKHLFDIKDRCHIIAVDSALPVLLASSIIPDFTISIDPQAYVTEHFLNSPENIPTIYSLSSFRMIHHRKPGFLTLGTHPVSQSLDQIYPGIGSIDSGTGSVAGDALKFAVLAGFKDIAILGLDSCFSGGKIYAKGTAYQNRYSLVFQTRLNPVETSNKRYIRVSSRSLVFSGKATRRSFLQYKEKIEGMVKDLSCKIFHVSEEGLRLMNTADIDFEEFVSVFCKNAIAKKDIFEGIIDKTKFIDSSLIKSKSEVLSNLIKTAVSSSQINNTRKETAINRLADRIFSLIKKN